MMNKEGWKYRDFKDVFPIKMGKTPPRGDAKSWDKEKKTHNKWVSIADISLNEGKVIYDTKEYISDEASSKINIVKKGSLLFSFKLSIGKMAFAGSDMFTNEAIIGIPENKDYLLKFIFYYFSNYDWKSLCEGKEKVKGATLNKESIGRIKLPIISTKEQIKIVEYLDNIFANIDETKKKAEHQIAEAEKLFQSALNDKLQMRDGWKSNRVNEVCRVINGRAYLKPEMLETGKYKILRVGNFFTNDKWYYSNLELEEDKYCNNGDLLYAWSASFGPRIWKGGKVIYHYHIWKIECAREINKLFLCYWLDSIVFKKQAMKSLHGATMNHITKGIMEECMVTYPSIEEQQSIVSTLDNISSKTTQITSKCQQIIADCDSLKQAILKQIFE